MSGALGAIRLAGGLIFTSMAAFFGWWAAVVLRNLFDPHADNSGLTYALVGMPLAGLAALNLALAWAALQGDRRRFAQVAAVTLTVVLLALLSLRVR